MPGDATANKQRPSWLKQLRHIFGEQPEHEYVLSGCSFAEVYRMAGWLKELYSSADFSADTICLAAENKAVIAAALLASLDGGPVLLLPFAFSSHVLAEMQEATGFVYAITDVERDFPDGTKLIQPAPDHDSSTEIDFDIDPDAELLRLFTGGTTGTPKSWSKTADNLFSEAFYLSEKYKITSQDLIVATVSPYHIYGLLFSVLLPLLSSATVVAETPSFPGEIINSVQSNGATIFVSVPVHYRILKGRRTSDNSLRLAFSSAGMLDQTDNEDFCKQNGIPVVEVYGSTETGGIATRIRCQKELAFYPFDTVTWKVVDEELYVCSTHLGPGLERGNDGFFIANDRVEIAQSGSFLLKGRSDTVTKVGGKRVDLGLIQETIKKQSGVEDCLVLSIAESGGRENMIAALVQPETINIKELRAKIASQLEPYAHPRFLKKTARFPLTASGKYDLAAIKQLFEK